MADVTVAEWIARRRELTTEATVGPWEWLAYGGGMQLVRRNAPYHDHNILKTTDDWPPYTQDAAFIADARTSLPLALDALEAVLALRPPAGSEKFGPDFEVGVAKGMQLARAAIETALRGES